jgi:alkaline phosphatase D
MDLDFATLREIAKYLPEDISVCMRGRHGIGKTELVRQLAKEFGLPAIERRLSQMSEGDLIGLPDQHDHVTTKFLPPDWFKEAMESPALIFLDEFDRADLPVKQAAMELILDRCIQGKRIHKDCRIYAAINGGKYGSNYHVQDLDIAINDRFWVADVEPSIDDWLNWAESNVIPEIVDFIRENNEQLELKKMPDVAHKVTPSRRSWTRLSNTLRNNPQLLNKKKVTTKAFKLLCRGFVGTTAASMFSKYLKTIDNITVGDVMDRFHQKLDKISSMKIDQQNFIVHKLHKYSANQDKPEWTKEQLENIFEFFMILTSEGQVNMWDKLTQPDCKIANSKRFAEKIAPTIKNLL